MGIILQPSSWCLKYTTSYFPSWIIWYILRWSRLVPSFVSPPILYQRELNLANFNWRSHDSDMMWICDRLSKADWNWPEYMNLDKFRICYVNLMATATHLAWNLASRKNTYLCIGDRVPFRLWNAKGKFSWILLSLNFSIRGPTCQRLSNILGK